MRPTDSAWAEVLGFAAMLGLSFALGAAAVLAAAVRDVRRERRLRLVPPVDLTSRLAPYTPRCPMQCDEPDCPYVSPAVERRTGA